MQVMQPTEVLRVPDWPSPSIVPVPRPYGVDFARQGVALPLQAGGPAK